MGDCRVGGDWKMQLSYGRCAVIWMELGGAELFGQIYYWCVQLLEQGYPVNVNKII